MWTTLDTFDTIYSADSVEWCPIEGFKDLFVCGTYQLNDGEEKVECPEGANPDMPLRVGKIYLFRVINSVLKLLQTLETDAILDMKWAHVKIRGNILLAIGDAKGFLKIYRLGVQDDTPRIKLLVETRVQPSEIELLVLSLDWNTGRCTDDTLDDVRIVVSDNKGAVSIYKLTGESFDLETITKKHEYEAWITCFDYWNTNIIYSGGDDCKFYRHDLRQLDHAQFGKGNLFFAGVTSLHSNAKKEFSLASGSYDEILRLWDTRKLEKPLSELHLRGGIWRLKWDPFQSDKLLAACMYGGFLIIDCSIDTFPQIIHEYNEHKSIAYGCDWSHLSTFDISSKIVENSSDNCTLISSCSFYDHTLKLSILDHANTVAR